MVKVKKEKASAEVKAPKQTKEKKQKAKAEPKVEPGTDDEAPEVAPIIRTDVGGGKNVAKKNKKKNQKTANGGIEKPNKQQRDPRISVMKKLKNIGKTTLDLKQPEVVAEPPAILATTEAITTAVIALRKATEEEMKEKKQLFDKDFRYCLQICQMKKPRAPTRQVRLNLVNSLYDDTDDVCLIVRDDKKLANRDPEVTVQQYEQLFRQNKIDFISKIFTLSQIRKDYGTLEMKRKLEQTYDVFFCDAIICSHTHGYLGKHFIKKHKCPLPVKIKDCEPEKLKTLLELTRRKTTYKQQPGGPIVAIPVATHKLTVDQFVANVEAVLNQLKKEYPGGWLNIKNIYLKPMLVSKVSLPLYISEINPNEVPIPVIIGPRAKHLINLASKLAEESDDETKEAPKKKEKAAKKEKVAVKKEESEEEVKEEEEEAVNGSEAESEPAEEEEDSEGEPDVPSDSEADEEAVSSPEPKKRKAPAVAAPTQKKFKKEKPEGKNAFQIEKKGGPEGKPFKKFSPKKGGKDFKNNKKNSFFSEDGKKPGFKGGKPGFKGGKPGFKGGNKGGNSSFNKGKPNFQKNGNKGGNKKFKPRA